MVRSMALGEISGRNGTRVFVKETVLGFLHGVAAGAFPGIIALAWTRDARLAAALAAALVLIPLGLRRISVDPALAAGVFGTTMTDVLEFALLLSLAAVTLGVLACSQRRLIAGRPVSARPAFSSGQVVHVYQDR
jgi:magnesium transporter